MPLVFELSSEFRNRNRFPRQGKFALDLNPPTLPKTNALDPVCFAMPIRSWQPGTNLNGTILNVSAHETPNQTSIMVQCTLDAQGQQPDFFTGCVITSSSDVTLMQRVWRSKAISPTELLIQIKDRPSMNIGQTIVISDYTSFSPIYVRAPGWEDSGRSTPHGNSLGTLLYNETLNQTLTITGLDLDTRQLRFVETLAPGWLTSHQLNIRAAVPTIITTLTSQSSNVVLLASSLEPQNVGDWLRLRLTNYSTMPISNSWQRKIIAVNGNMITLDFAPPTTAPGSILELLDFGYDNAQGISINDQSMTMIWDVALESLLIPNTEIMWGNIKSCSHFAVGLSNQQSVISNKNIINSNNPWLQQTVFLCQVVNSNDRWIKCHVAENCIKRLILNIREPICLNVWLPNGREFKTVLSDGISPQPSVPDLQVWATIALTPIFNTNHSSAGERPFNSQGFF